MTLGSINGSSPWMFTTARRLAAAHHLGDTIRSAGMIGGGHFRAAKGLGHFPNSGVVGGHNHFAERLGLLAAFDDVLDERLAGDQGQRLAGKTGRAVTRGNDADDVHVSRKIQGGGGRVIHDHGGG